MIQPLYVDKVILIILISYHQEFIMAQPYTYNHNIARMSEHPSTTTDEDMISASYSHTSHTLKEGIKYQSDLFYFSYFFREQQNTKFGLGISVLNDTQENNLLINTSTYLNLGIRQRILKKHYFSFGVETGCHKSKIDISNLLFPDQITNGGIFNQDIYTSDVSENLKSVNYTARFDLSFQSKNLNYVITPNLSLEGFSTSFIFKHLILSSDKILDFPAKRDDFWLDADFRWGNSCQLIPSYRRIHRSGFTTNRIGLNIDWKVNQKYQNDFSWGGGVYLDNLKGVQRQNINNIILSLDVKGINPFPVLRLEGRMDIGFNFSLGRDNIFGVSTRVRLFKWRNKFSKIDMLEYKSFLYQNLTPKNHNKLNLNAVYVPQHRPDLDTISIEDSSTQIIPISPESIKICELKDALQLVFKDNLQEMFNENLIEYLTDISKKNYAEFIKKYCTSLLLNITRYAPVDSEKKEKAKILFDLTIKHLQINGFKNINLVEDIQISTNKDSIYLIIKEIKK